MEPKEVLHKAREIIERDGWTQGELYDTEAARERFAAALAFDGEAEARFTAECEESAKRGRVCAIGAVRRAVWGTASPSAMETDARYGAVGLALKLLRNELGLAGEELIPEWNDAPNTTREDVLLAFKRAAGE